MSLSYYEADLSFIICTALRNLELYSALLLRRYSKTCHIMLVYATIIGRILRFLFWLLDILGVQKILQKMQDGSSPFSIL